MRLLAFSDLHTDRRQAQRLVAMSREADIVIAAGDFASFHLGLRRTIGALRPIAAPVLLVPGNNETERALRRACDGWPSAVVLHGQCTRISGTDFFGLGGGVPATPFPFSFDLSEEQARARLADCPDGAVLIVHSPPRGYVDDAHGRHLGSAAILDTIESRAPRLALCGHVHEAWGCEAMIGSTRVLNLGPDGVLLEV